MNDLYGLLGLPVETDLMFWGWLIYFIIPMIVFIEAAVWFVGRRNRIAPARAFTRAALLLTAWMYFLLNTAFFEYPWPWREWTIRTPNWLIFAVCIAGVTIIALVRHRKSSAQSSGTVDTG